MNRTLKQSGIFTLLFISTGLMAAQPEVTLMKRSATVDFVDVGTVKTRSIECPMGSTPLSAQG